jgi:hypothetical protein
MNVYKADEVCNVLWLRCCTAASMLMLVATAYCLKTLVLQVYSINISAGAVRVKSVHNSAANSNTLRDAAISALVSYRMSY